MGTLDYEGRKQSDLQIRVVAILGAEEIIKTLQLSRKSVKIFFSKSPEHLRPSVVKSNSSRPHTGVIRILICVVLPASRRKAAPAYVVCPGIRRKMTPNLRRYGGETTQTQNSLSEPKRG